MAWTFIVVCTKKSAHGEENRLKQLGLRMMIEKVKTNIEVVEKSELKG